MKNGLENIEKRAEHLEERISEIEDRNLEMMQVDEKRKFKNEEILQGLLDSFKEGQH